LRSETPAMGTSAPEGSTRDPRQVGSGGRSDVATTEWTLHCLRCKYARNFGAAKLGALHAGDAHLRRFPHHMIVVRECKIFTVLRRTDPPLPDPSATDEIPF